MKLDARLQSLRSARKEDQVVAAAALGVALTGVGLLWRGCNNGATCWRVSAALRKVRPTFLSSLSIYHMLNPSSPDASWTMLCAPWCPSQTLSQILTQKQAQRLGYRVLSTPLVHKQYIHSQRARYALQLEAQLEVTPQLSKLIQADFARQMHAGLRQDKDKSSLLMLPSWLSHLPTGSECGSVLAVDCGGTSFRVLHAVLGADRSVVVRFPCSHHLRASPFDSPLQPMVLRSCGSGAWPCLATCSWPICASTKECNPNTQQGLAWHSCRIGL